MLKKSNAKWVIGLLAIPALLAGCSKTDLPIEAPEVVLKKSLSYPMEAYESNMVMNVNLSDKTTKQSGDMVFEFDQKGDLSEEAIISEVLMKMNADLNVTSPTSESPESMMLDAEASFIVNGEDMFAELNKLEVEGEHSEVATIQGLLPLIAPYLNQTFYIDPEKSRELNSELESVTQLNVNVISEAEMIELRKKMADSELLKVSKENGIKKITTVGGKKVPAYHYDIELQPENIGEFLDAISEINENLGEEEKSIIEEMASKLNEKIQFEMWIGQEDYFPYKTTLTVDPFNMKEIIDYVRKIQGFNTEINEEEAQQLESLIINLAISNESQPLDSVDIEIPNKEETTDLFLMIEGMANALMGGVNMETLPSSSIESMTDDEIEAMMEGVSSEELDAMMESSGIN